MEEPSRDSVDSLVRLEFLRIKNYRVLQDMKVSGLSPFAALAGPNGSGKSTLFDVLAFLQEAFSASLRQAVESRFGLRELRTRGQSGPIEIEIHVRFADSKFGYEIIFDERDGVPVVLSERGTVWERDGIAVDEQILSVSEGKGWISEFEGDVAALDFPDKSELAAPLVGRIGTNGWLVELRRFVSQWFLSAIDLTEIRHIPEAGPQSRLTRSGDNLTNVLEWLAQRHPAQLETIEARLRKFVPRLERIGPVATADGRSMLQLKDVSFETGIPARFASDGTLKLLAYLTVLQQASSLPLMGFEEPELYMAPQTLFPIAEAMRETAGEAQILLTTHSPIVLNAFRPHEVWMLYRNENGFARGIKASEIRGVREAMEEGAVMGNLWLQGFLGVGDPTKNGGMPVQVLGDR